MQSASSSSSWSLDYVPPSVDYLLNCKIEGPQLDVEDALCTPDDQEVFLTASMTFLQNHLMQKLHTKNRFGIPKNKPTRAYSDLLIIEANSNSKREKFYIKLKNTDRYDAVLKMESTVPVYRALSLEEMLPVPKKNLKPSKSGIFRFLKSNSNPVLTQMPENEKPRLFRNIFRKTHSKHKPDKTIAFYETCDLRDKSLADLLKLKQARCQLYVDLLPNPSSMLSLRSNFEYNQTSASSLALNRLKMAPSFVKPKFFGSSSTAVSSSHTYESDCSSQTEQNRSEGKKNHLNDGLKILHFMSEQQAETLKKSLYDLQKGHTSEKFKRKGGNKSLEFTSNAELNFLEKCNAKTNLTQPSKLSVCLEDGSESEDEEFGSCLQILNYSFGNCTNFTDEVKSKFSSEFVPIVVKQF